MVPGREKWFCKKLRTQITRYEKSLILQGFELLTYADLRGDIRHFSRTTPLEISLRAIAHGFESHPLRQKPSHIKAFAHMTGLFFSLKVTSACMIFGKSSGVPAGLLQQPLQLLLPAIVRNVPLLLGALHLVGGAKGSRSILTAYFSALWIIFSLAILIWAN